MKRVIPQNFGVLLNNLPSIVETKDDLQVVIAPIVANVNAILPTPKQAADLTECYEGIIEQK